MPTRERRLILGISRASPEEVLRLWRFEPIGSEYFEGKVGDALTSRIAEIRSTLSDTEWVALSKRVGWNPTPFK